MIYEYTGKLFINNFSCRYNVHFRINLNFAYLNNFYLIMTGRKSTILFDDAAQITLFSLKHWSNY